MDDRRVRRSLLIAPAHLVELVGKLSRTAADVCILELEDGVHPDLKAQARAAAVQELMDLDWSGRERIVRINRVTTAEGQADIAALASGRPDGLLLPKVESEDEIKLTAALLTEAEKTAGIPVGSIHLWSMIETARGLLRADAIAAADPRMTGLLFGAGDYGADIQIKRLGLGSVRRFPAPSHEYLYARGRVVAASRAAGIDAVDVGHSTVTDVVSTRRTAEISAQMGFVGSAVFHPRQVSAVNEAFSPSEEDLAWAHEVLDRTRAEAAKEQAGTVVVVNGEMIDGPFVINAGHIIDLDRRIQALEQRKSGNTAG